jgi:hypothetical protein
MTALYRVDPYHMLYCLKKVLEPDSMIMVAVIWTAYSPSRFSWLRMNVTEEIWTDEEEG